MMLQTTGLGIFLPAHWTVPQNPLEANALRGLGIFLPANYTLPQNPLGMGAIVEGFPLLPENPIVLEIRAKEKMAEALQKNPNGPVGLSCGPATCPCQVGLCGLDGTLDDILGSVTNSGWQTWAIAGLAVVAAGYLLTGGQRRSELSSARAEYKSKVASARARYRSARHQIKYAEYE